ncbi:MAG: NPCBM/NEW2 domain-containing protein [Planctomycetes bacterium]|nr:NPCBM/NEW2 domain-containing protein [Planctomycetota bacterium]
MHRIIALLTLLPLTSALPQSAPPSGPRVVLEGTRGASEVRALDGFETADPRTLGAHVVRFEGLPSIQSTKGSDTARVELQSGERLFGNVTRAGDETLNVLLAGNVQLGVHLEDIRSIQFERRLPTAWNAPLERAQEGDRVYRRKNDTLERIDGGVEAFGETSFRFHDERIGSLEVAWSELVALFIDSSHSTRAAQAESAVPIVVDLFDHSRIHGALTKIDSLGVALVRRGGEALRIPGGLVAQVLVDDGRVVFLSDLAPQSAPPSVPFGDDLGMRWPHKSDASVMDTPLTAGGRVYARGLGVHAPSRLTWALDGSFEALRGAVAVDDSVLRLPERGSVRFRVLVDGVKRFESKILRGGDAPLPIQLDPPSLVGAKELVLEVDTAEDNFVADRADWLQVLLVRTAQAK